ncbi:acyltransferase domain-containing protein [Mycolicibacterium stellerae]|uniref:acyltransferase domain-containing protein n=1 Tax=Mycolicibacterium stellerae TaxID=2358193 RepID=UPI000F0B739F|nr:acyltransferase domain-containing protein [Mycolicibacterium stellerae]
MPDGGTVFVFPGQGPQSTPPAIEPAGSAPAFAEEMRRCDAAFAEFMDWSVLEAAHGGAASVGLDRVDVMRPVLFAVTVSLVAHQRALGIHPDAVIGHSRGEIAAAYVAGALSLPDAAKVVTVSSTAINAIAGTGAMVSISSPVDPVLESMRANLAGLEPRKSAIEFISGVTGAGLDTSILDCDYWYATLRQPVLFEQAIRWAYEKGYRTFIEASPHPVLTADIRESLAGCGAR